MTLLCARLLKTCYIVRDEVRWRPHPRNYGALRLTTAHFQHAFIIGVMHFFIRIFSRQLNFKPAILSAVFDFTLRHSTAQQKRSKGAKVSISSSIQRHRR